MKLDGILDLSYLRIKNVGGYKKGSADKTSKHDCERNTKFLSQDSGNQIAKRHKTGKGDHKNAHHPASESVFYISL